LHLAVIELQAHFRRAEDLHGAVRAPEFVMIWVIRWLFPLVYMHNALSTINFTLDRQGIDAVTPR
jgi:hypothetical protein